MTVFTRYTFPIAIGEDKIDSIVIEQGLGDHPVWTVTLIDYLGREQSRRHYQKKDQAHRAAKAYFRFLMNWEIAQQSIPA